ncbi:MAG: hypothetical protein PVJ43_05745 [Gemmatimonadales bacterium]|jgi:hypothetical protein
MPNRATSTWRRTVNRYVPLIGVTIGLVLILSGLANVDASAELYMRVIVGIVLVVGGYFYAQHPFLSSERKYSQLREEVDNFIGLVRRLNRTAVAIGGGPEFDDVTTAMRQSVARIEELAKQETE